MALPKNGKPQCNRRRVRWGCGVGAKELPDGKVGHEEELERA